MISFGVDIGGSGVKGAPVNLATGELTHKRLRLPTPAASTPANVVETVQAVVDHHEWNQPLGVTFPGVVVNGVVLTAANMAEGWVGFDAATVLSERLERPVTVVNDADAAGIAELRYGAHDATDGVVVVLTFGTGIGSALFHNGVLVPNTEFGHLEFRGMEAEQYAAGRLVKRDNADIEWWAGRVNEFLQHVEFIFSPTKIIFGGGISKRFEEFSAFIETRAEVVPARLRNNAGIVGAAMVAGPREQT